jgi:tetratricopeptide (TPR) repeat protein
LYAEGRLDEVEDVLRTVIERDPHSPLAYHLLGTVYLERKDEERAFKLFSEGAHQFPNHAALHYDLGFLYARRGLGSLARQELSRAVAIQPEGVQADRARRLLHGGPAGAPRAGLHRPPPPLEPADRPVAEELIPQEPPAAPGESPAEAVPDGAPDGQSMEE